MSTIDPSPGRTPSTPAAGGLQFRRMRDDETRLVGRLVRDAYAGDYELTDAYLDEIEAVGDRAREHEVWVAADAATGEVLGTVTTPRPGRRMSAVARQEDELDFRFLGVSGAARGRGVGEAMVRHVVALAAARGLRRVVLNTGEQMAAARRLYERLGFERLLEREFTFERPDGTPVHILAFGIDVRGSISGPAVATAPAA
ncbi:GNAT family N-acetyltransferase [Agromyces sp. SYSU T0242]|uniref:GNAT family N-acetyltransferase n=1 Tax=Agromyces litoreus TaxID=3158561 RepID=UPI00339551A5